MNYFLYTMGGKKGELHHHTPSFLKKSYLAVSATLLNVDKNKLTCPFCFSVQDPTVSDKNTKKFFFFLNNFDIPKIV